MDLLSRGSPTEPEYTSNCLLAEALWRRWGQTTLSADDLFGETTSQFRYLFKRELDVAEVVKESKEFWAKAHGLVAVNVSRAEQDLTGHFRYFLSCAGDVVKPLFQPAMLSVFNPIYITCLDFTYYEYPWESKKIWPTESSSVASSAYPSEMIEVTELLIIVQDIRTYVSTRRRF